MKAFITFFLFLIAFNGVAAEQSPRTMKGYCTVVEERVVALAANQDRWNADMAIYAVDRPTANVSKFNEASRQLEIFSNSLKENEEEWSRLNCAHILYPRLK